MMQTITKQISNNYAPSPEEPVMESLMSEYKRVIFESLLTSFGLDSFLVTDRHGGDVDTIHNVRKIGKDPEMTYKNVLNEKAYTSNGKYDTKEYHSDEGFSSFKSEARKAYRETGQTVKDAYTGKELHFLGKGKGANSKISAEADHVIAAKAIHEDRGRVLSGVSGVDLANSEDNLRFTNKSLNASMGADEIPDYIAKHPELDPQTKSNMMNEYNQAKSVYESRITRAYYTSPRFAKDLGVAAGKLGVRMGARQALGFFFAEVTFTVMEEFDRLPRPFELGTFLKSLGTGIKNGFSRALKKYKELLSHACEGAVSGALSSLSTTLCNIFFTTAKNAVKIVRQTYVSLVQAAKVLFLNPDNLPFGERMRATAKILAVGVSVVLGTMVSELIEQSPIGKIPVLGDAVQTFCGALVSGLLTCTLLHYMDNSETVGRLVSSLNHIYTIDAEVAYFRQVAEQFERYAAELEQIDYEKFRTEVDTFNMIGQQLDNIQDEKQLNVLLKKYITLIGGALPWQGDFNAFMQQKDTPLAFA
ncbi:MAG TPA: hypothetical protein H9945_03585 [Candidatus Gemmiger avicola]|uniref:Uncharacterized protein n=1 Tax=Candidatus Gemmiger avicola TaxID=2838605 RepID=A0A9D2M676_9FIRM|nr:hypothetical protein [Candidatus Gemmiger avicola]